MEIPVIEQDRFVSSQPAGDRTELILRHICARRSLSPKRLAPPAPSREEVAQMIQAAVTAPDHEQLRPWRFIYVSGAATERLARLFAEAKQKRAPLASREDIDREYQRGKNCPGTLCVITRLKADLCKVPKREQYASVGAAMQNILLVAGAMGYGARILSGAKSNDSFIAQGLGLKENEELMGFICMGTPQRRPLPREPVGLMDHLEFWPAEQN